MSNNSKTFLTGEEAKNVVYNGIEKLYTAVSSTLGPGGRHVAIHRGLTHVTKDGVTVANALTLKDPGENIGANIIKNVTAKMAFDAGDGTTTATVLATALIQKIRKQLNLEANPIHLKDGMDQALKFVTDMVEENAIQIDEDSPLLEDIAIISANHDEPVGKLIAEAIKRVGADGIVDVEKGVEPETKLEIKEGMMFEKGYFSPYFITNMSTGKAEFTNAIVLLYADKMDRLSELLPILETVKMEKRPIIIIAEDFETRLAQTIILNRLQNGLEIALIQSPGFAKSKLEALEDISAFIDGTVVGAETGISLAEIKDLSILGSVDRIVISEKETVLIKEKKNKLRVKERIAQLNSNMKEEKNAQPKASLKKRISKLNGAAVTIKVGGNSEMEIYEQGDRIDDALHAAKSALKEGVVPGGGTIYYHCSYLLKKHIDNLYRDKDTDDIKTGMTIVMDALMSPMEHIVANTGENKELVRLEMSKSVDVNFGYDAKNRKFGDMYKMHILDPAKVTRLAIESAVSVAKIFLTLDCIIIDEVEDKK